MRDGEAPHPRLRAGYPRLERTGMIAEDDAEVRNSKRLQADIFGPRM